MRFSLIHQYNLTSPGHSLQQKGQHHTEVPSLLHSDILAKPSSHVSTSL